MGPKDLDGKSVDDWIEEYAESHQHPINRFCHTLGIPMIAASLILLPVALLLWVFGVTSAMPSYLGVGMFAVGWVFQFVGHWVEGKPPEFLRDRRFLRIGLLWWFRKVRGKR